MRTTAGGDGSGGGSDGGGTDGGGGVVLIRSPQSRPIIESLWTNRTADRSVLQN